MDEPAIDARVFEFLQLKTDPADLSEHFLVEFNGRNQARTLAGIAGQPARGSSQQQPDSDETPVKQAEAV